HGGYGGWGIWGIMLAHARTRPHARRTFQNWSRIFMNGVMETSLTVYGSRTCWPAAPWCATSTRGSRPLFLRDPFLHEFMVRNRPAGPTPRLPDPDEFELRSGVPGRWRHSTEPATPLSTRRKKCLKPSIPYYRAADPTSSGALSNFLRPASLSTLKARYFFS